MENSLIVVQLPKHAVWYIVISAGEVLAMDIMSMEYLS